MSVAATYFTCFELGEAHAAIRSCLLRLGDLGSYGIMHVWRLRRENEILEPPHLHS